MKEETFLLETAIVRPTAGADAPPAWLPALLDAAYRARRKKPARMDLLLADDREMARLNRRHLGIDAPTDVLAFEDGETEGDRVRLGDVAVGFETARRTAAERGGEFSLELAFYALHGLLHLLGMRDDDDAERAEMLAAQLAAMRAFGLEAGEDMLAHGPE